MSRSVPLDFTGIALVQGVWSALPLNAPEAWEFRVDPAADGIPNMAADLALMDRARHDGVAGWRCYGWQHPTVSFGRNERVRGRFTAESIAAAGLEAVRRPTGGRALLHDRELTYCVALPLPPSVPWKPVYDAINVLLASALHAAGFPVVITPDPVSTGVAPLASAASPDGPLCWDHPSPGELALHGRKLVGSAVWRDRGAFLQHGSILLADSQRRLLDAAIVPVAPPAPAATVEDDSVAHIIACMRRALSHIAPVTDTVRDASFDVAAAAHARDVGSADWLWRR